MQMLFLFLKWVATFHETNKMDVTNLARVIAPTVFYSSAATKELTVERQQSARDEIKVVEMLIRYQEEFCMVSLRGTWEQHASFWWICVRMDQGEARCLFVWN